MVSVIAQPILNVFCWTNNYYVIQAMSLAGESSTANRTDDSMWQPKEGTRSEWMTCRGMPKDVCERTKIKKKELQKLLAKQFGVDDIGKVSAKNIFTYLPGSLI